MKLIKLFKDKAFRFFERSNAGLVGMSEKQLIALARMLAKQNSEIAEIDNFGKIEFSAFSQWGEDGIINWLISNLPDIPKSFVEFGVSDYKESNTRLLLQTHNWRGLVIDGSSENIKKIQREDLYWRHDITAKEAFIEKNNINNLILSEGMSGDIGLLSIDLDGNDYWIWKEINVISPVIVVVEYNAVFGDLHSITVPYRPDFDRTSAHFSNLYFGCSIRALIDLGAELGYTFLGTNTNGVNAFFAKNSYYDVICKNVPASWAFPSKTRESRDVNNLLNFISGVERIKIISDKVVYDTRDRRIRALNEYRSTYSDCWANGDPILVDK